MSSWHDQADVIALFVTERVNWLAQEPEGAFPASLLVKGGCVGMTLLDTPAPDGQIARSAIGIENALGLLQRQLVLAPQHVNGSADLS